MSLRAVARMKSKPCADCGIKYPSYVMDFDHRDPKTKTANVSRMLRCGKPLSEVLAEIKKCDVVCANCHRERTHGQNTDNGSNAGTGTGTCL